MEGDVITNARHDIAQDGRGYEISMSMNAQGAKKWKRLTGENIDRKIAIVLDRRVFELAGLNKEISSAISLRI